MKRLIAILMLLVPSVVLFAQETKNPVTTVINQILPRQQKNLIAAVEAMPADKFNYQPTPQQMTFAALVMHIIESNNYLCSKASDTRPPKADLKENEGKDKLVIALKASFDFCTQALSKVDDSKLGDTVELYGGKQGPRAFTLIALTNDWADHYAAAAMYLRLNGVLPPTAQPH